MALTLDQFGKMVVTSGLLTADEVKAFYNQLPQDSRPKDADGLAKALVAGSKLTPFQAGELLAGRGGSLQMGDYVLLSEIGAGGMGKVYMARHRRMKRIVALKVMSRAAMKDEAAVKRFQREVEAAARLEHPNIVTAYDSGESGNVKYLVMQFVDGGDLSSLIKKGGVLPVEQAVGFVLQAARGLSFAHAKGVIHRDIKPANLLVDRDGVVKILDMGLARMEDSEGLTATEQVMGTVDYMSPEQAADTKNADARSDVYSLGCTLWFLLTGKRLYDGDTMISRLMKHRDAPLPALVKERDDVSWPLEQVFQKMIAKQATERYASMDEVIAALEPFRTSDGSSRDSGKAGSSNAELSSFVQAMRVGGPAVSKPATTTGVNPEATIAFASSEVGTDPKSLHQIESPPPPAKPAAKKAPAQKKQPPVVLIAGGVGILVLLVGLGAWLLSSKPNVEDVTQSAAAGGVKGASPSTNQVAAKTPSLPAPGTSIPLATSTPSSSAGSTTNPPANKNRPPPNFSFGSNLSNEAATPAANNVAFRGHRYRFVPLPATRFPDARKGAEGLKGHLATISDQAEFDFVKGLIPANTPIDARIWIGGLRLLAEPNWRWITNEPWSFTAWDAGQPDVERNSNSNLALCVTPSGVKWVDEHFNLTANVIGYIIEWSPQNVLPDAEGLVYLDDMAPTAWTGASEQLRTHGIAYGGNPLSWKNTQPKHSLFTHAPDNGTARLSFALDARYETFTAEVGAVSGPGPATPLVFRVMGDGRELWKSMPIHKRTDQESFSISVQGVNDLTLEVDCPGSSQHAHAVWVNPRLTVVPSPTPAPPSESDTKRWPLAPSQPADITWVHAALKADMTLRTGPATDLLVKSSAPLPTGPATIVGIEFPRTAGPLATDDNLKRIATFADLESLRLSFASVSDSCTKDGLPQLNALQQLRHLTLGRIGPPDTDPAMFGSFSRLESLDLEYLNIPDWESHTARMSSLKKLRLFNMDAAKLERLGPLPRLTEVSLGGYPTAHHTRLATAQRYAPIVPWCRFILIGMDNDHKKQMTIEPTAPVPSPTTSPPSTKAIPLFTQGLTGWVGQPNVWTFANGELVGTLPSKGATFLYSPSTHRDFELSFQVRLRGGCNSGVQFRSQILDAMQFTLTGPQCEIGATGKTGFGGLWWEKGTRNGVQQAVTPEVFNQLLKPDDYNDITLKCVGRRVTITLNGTMTVDGEFDIPAEGLLGWQLVSAGEPVEARFRNIQFLNR